MKKVLVIIVLLVGSILASPTKIYIWDNDLAGVFQNPDSTDPNDKIGSEKYVREALVANGYTNITMSTDFPTNISQYAAVFVLDGFYPNTGTITETQQETLANYIQIMSGRLYIEGGDFGYNYRNGTLFSMLGATYNADGRQYYGLNQGNVNFATGCAGTIASGLHVKYPGYNANISDNYLDELSLAAGFKNNVLLFTSDRNGIVANGRVIANTDTYGTSTYRTIYSSLLFSGLQNGSGNNNRTYLMNLYLNYMAVQTRVAPTSLGAIKASFR